MYMYIFIKMFQGYNQEESFALDKDKTTLMGDFSSMKVKMMQVPVISHEDDESNWINRLGKALIKDIEIRIGGRLVYKMSWCTDDKPKRCDITDSDPYLGKLDVPHIWSIGYHMNEVMYVDQMNGFNVNEVIHEDQMNGLSVNEVMHVDQMNGFNVNEVIHEDQMNGLNVNEVIHEDQVIKKRRCNF